MTGFEDIRIEASPARVRAMFEGHVIADTADALVLTEAGRAPVCYFPRKDVEMGFMARTGRSFRRPALGAAVFYGMLIEGEIAEDLLWSYEDPEPLAEALRDRIAFDASRVEVYALSDQDMARAPRAARAHDRTGGGQYAKSS